MNMVGSCLMIDGFYSQVLAVMQCILVTVDHNRPGRP